MYTLTFVLAYAFIAASAAPEPHLASAIVTAQSSQYIARNYNALVTPVAAYVAQPVHAAKTAGFVAQPVLAAKYVAQPVVTARTAAEFVAAKAQPVVAAKTVDFVAQPFLATQNSAYVAQTLNAEHLVHPAQTAAYFTQPAKSIVASKTADYVAQPVVAAKTAAIVAQPVLATPNSASLAQQLNAERLVHPSQTAAYFTQPVKTAAYITSPIYASNAAYVAQPFLQNPAAYIAQPSSFKSEDEKTQTQAKADLFKTAAYIAQSSRPALAATRKSSEEIKTNPAAETFEPVSKSVSSDDIENSGDGAKRVDVDAIANVLAPTVLATRFAGSPVYSYYNPYITQPVVV